MDRSEEAWAVTALWNYCVLATVYSPPQSDSNVDYVKNSVEFLIAGFATCAGISTANKAQYCDHLCRRCKI